MTVMTDDEVCDFLEKNSWATGIKVAADGNLFNDSPDANGLVMSFPETPLRATYVSRLISML